MSKLRQLDKYGLEPYKKYGYIALFFLLLDVAIGIGIPYISKLIIDTYLPEHNWDMIWLLSGLMVGLVLMGLVSLILNGIFSQKAATHGATDLRLSVFKKIQGFSIKNVDKYKHGRLITSCTNDIQQIQQFYTMKYTMFARGPLYLIGGVIFAIMTSPELSMVYIGVIPALILVVLTIMFFARPLFKKQQESVDAINIVAVDNVNAPRVFKTFVTEEAENKRFEVVNDAYRTNTFKAARVLNFFMPMSTLILNSGLALTIVLGAYFMQNGTMTPDNSTGTFMAFQSYSMKIMIGIMMFSMMFMFMARAGVCADRVAEILNEKVDLVEKTDALEDFSLKGEIEFKNVSFKYEEDSNNIFTNLNLKIKAGQSVGIIGSTGSGKSSLIKMIPRLYDPSEGEVLIDGVDVKDYNIKQLRKQISMATQEAIIFSGTIRSNIEIGNEVALQDEIENAAEMACAKEFILSKENTYDSQIDQRGTNLSGGQKQRLSLSRALVRSPKILILDDVTSALDAKSEETVRNNLSKMKDMTTIIVSQKISSIKELDKIVVFDNYGNIDGYDTHDNLLVNSKVYKELYESQFGGVE